MSTLILIFASALLFAVSATPGARWLALKLGIVDQPASRKVHVTPIPRFGGIAKYGAVVVANRTELCNNLRKGDCLSKFC